MFLGLIEHFLSEDTACTPKNKMAAAAILNFGVHDVSSDKKASLVPRNICAKGEICTKKCSS